MDASTPSKLDGVLDQINRFKPVLEIVGIIVVVVTLILTKQTVAATQDTVTATNEAVTAANEAVTAAYDQISNSRYEAAYGHETELFSLVSQHPEIAPYILDGKMPTDLVPATPLADQVKGALYQAVDLYLFEFNLAPQVDYGQPHTILKPDQTPPTGIDQANWNDWRTWAQTIDDGFRDAPGMCALVQADEAEYGDNFINAVKQAIPNCLS